MTQHKLILSTYTPTDIILQECQNPIRITPQLNTLLLLWVPFSSICCL